jgi:hypothetical protein
MVKKISFAILSLAILVTGVIALKKLNYWESSVWIFKLNSGQLSEGRNGHGQGDGRGRGGFRDERRIERAEGIDGQQRPGERFEGSPMRELPDSIRERFSGRGRGPGMRDRNFSDSLRRDFSHEFSGRSERVPNDAGFRSHDGRGRGDFSGEKKINLRNVLWYLAAFASFTIVAIYSDKALKLIRKRKKSLQYK